MHACLDYAIEIFLDSQLCRICGIEVELVDPISARSGSAVTVLTAQLLETILSFSVQCPKLEQHLELLGSFSRASEQPW